MLDWEFQPLVLAGGFFYWIGGLLGRAVFDRVVAVCYFCSKKMQNAGGAAMASPMRLSTALIEAAEREGAVQKRSTPKQIEFWAELGKAVERVVDLADVYAVIQGIKRLKVEPVASVAVDPQEVLVGIENSRRSGELAARVTSAAVYYEASPGRPGLLDRVNGATGERQTGQFQDGKFRVQA
jgi:hypothetical protein